MAFTALPDADIAPVAVMRAGQDELTTALSAAAQVFVDGAEVDWSAVVPAGVRVELPTYAFQRQRFWLSGSAAGDPVGLGQRGADHPLLGAAVELADGEVVFTGQWSLASQPWLADHAVMGMVLLPGTAFVELALHTGELVGCARVAELTLQAPLVIPADAAVAVQVRVGIADESGSRSLTVYSRREDVDTGLAGEAGGWVCHAEAVLDGGEPAPVMGWAVQWPPAGAQPVGVADAYDRFADRGFEYGPVFQGLQAVWRRGEELFAEVGLPEQSSDQAHRFGIHPALLDAALHAMLATATDGDGGQVDSPRLPFSWNGVQIHAGGRRSVAGAPGCDRSRSGVAAGR